MTDNISSLDFMRRLGPDGRSIPPETLPKRNELTDELQRYMHVLGPAPNRCLEALADLGLSDPEIARYFKIPGAIVTDLRQVWKIGGET